MNHVADYGYRYYDPLTGRWPSRDPIAEEAFFERYTSAMKFSDKQAMKDEALKPAYLFVLNDPTNGYDVHGLAGPIIPIGIVVGVVVGCAYPQFKAAWDRYPDSSDKFKHCWVSCRISKTCGGAISQIAGFTKEVRDRLIAAFCDQFPDLELCQEGHGDFWDSLDDIAANNQCIGRESNFGLLGGWIGSIFRDSCECCCEKKVGGK
jgi:hypothetical protein